MCNGQCQDPACVNVMLSKNIGYWQRGLIVGVMIVFIAFIVVFVCDLMTYKSGGRPWLETNDDLFGIFMVCRNVDSIVATHPICGTSLEFTMTHKWRGKYQPVLRMSDVYKDFTELKEGLGMTCTFMREDGTSVYEYSDRIKYHRWWMKSRDERHPGSDMCFTMYSVPNDVPLDEKVKVVIQLLGDVNTVLSKHPQAYITIEKRPDK